jgi:alcohol dehydrogenase (cytochrome c)
MQTWVLILLLLAAGSAAGDPPVTDVMLRNPPPDDWLMYSRTYDAQRHCPLKHINTGNVGRLALAWSRGLPAGTTETIPLVYAGVMYVIAPGARVLALDARSGDRIWEYIRPLAIAGAAEQARAKNLAISTPT